ncbi:cyclic nucleotide-binding domain-containing protein [bacterium]|nr:cyclic nucleotide-binding domain-containing protein [bacterium]
MTLNNSQSNDSDRNQYLLNHLKNTYLFNIFNESELLTIISFCEEYTIPAQTIMFEEGDIPDHFYIITSGRVRVYQTIRDKENITISLLEQGDYFGEMSLLDGFPRSATACTESETELLSMSFARFDELMQKYKNIGIKWLWTFCRILSARLRDTNEKYKSLLGQEK